MKKQTFLSVVMPVYNAETYLAESVRSIWEQTFSDWELILVNDASSDRSGDMCDTLASQDERIHVIHLEENRGAGHARNCGMELASGEYLTFMDADDTIEDALYEKIYACGEKNRPDEIVWGVTEDYYDADNQLVMQNKISLQEISCDTVSKTRKNIIKLEEKTLFGYQWNHAYKLEIIRDNHIVINDMILYEDYFFNLAVIQHVATMTVLHDTAYHYKKRMNESITGRFVPEYFELCTKRVGSLYECYQKWGMYSPAVRDILGNIYLRYSLSGLMRNNDPQADMSRKEKKQWVKDLFASQLYQKTAMNCNVKSMPLKVLQGLLNKRCVCLCLLMGQFVYFIKNKRPMTFSKKKIVK
ncbi:MAG: glycosyltransferase family 2 protein [Lachnospiraceae bacterium]|nr:glycosyltransferase family 2 protein [Lachnospiraceae bacterium]